MRRPRVLRDVRERLGDDEVGGELDRPRAAARRASASSVTGTGTRATSACSAGSSPRSVSNAGWIPRASSRSSERPVCSSSCARSSSSLTGPAACARAVRSSSASATSRACAPSCRSRSSRRRSASPASTSRAREARSSSSRSRSSASSWETWLRSSPPRNANGSSADEMNAAHHAASPAPAFAVATSRNVSSAQTYTGVSWSRSSGGVARQRRTERTSTSTNSTAYASAPNASPAAARSASRSIEQQVRRAARAAEVLRPGERQRGRGGQREDHVTRDHERAIDPGREPPRREAHAEVQEDAAPEPAREQRERVDRTARPTRARIEQEPREAEQHHQQRRCGSPAAAATRTARCRRSSSRRRARRSPTRPSRPGGRWRARPRRPARRRASAAAAIARTRAAVRFDGSMVAGRRAASLPSMTIPGRRTHRASVRQHRHRDALVAPQQHGARDRRRAEALAHVVDRRVERGARGAGRTAARAGPRRRRRGWRARRRAASAPGARSAAAPPRAARAPRPGSPASRAVASVIVCERVARVKSSKRSRITTVRQTRRAAPQPPCHAVDQPDEHRVELSRRPPPAAERPLRADRAAPPPDPHPARVAVVRERVQLPPGRTAEHPDQPLLGQLRDLARPSSIPRSRSLRAVTGPTPHSASIGSGCRNSSSRVGRHDEQAVGLCDAARDLGEELGPRDPDRDRQADLARARARRSRAAISAGVPGDPAHPAHVEERLVDRQRPRRPATCPRRPRRPPCSPPSTPSIRGGTTTACGHSRRASPAAHRALHAERLRLVAGREHHAAADDHRPPAQPRVVALLDRREERVEVGVEDRGLG